MTFVSLGADGAPTYTLQTLDEWIARVKARGHIMLEEKQLKFHIERYSNIAPAARAICEVALLLASNIVPHGANESGERPTRNVCGSSSKHRARDQ